MKLRVKACGTALVPCHEHEAFAGDGHMKRYIGRIYDVDARAWRSTGELVEVPTCPESDPSFSTYLAEYRAHVKAGSLLAADEATAIECGVAHTSKAAAHAEVSE